MCIIMVKPKGIAMPNDELLTKLYNANPDGAGVAYSCKKSVYMKKGFMTLESFLDFCHKIPNAIDRIVVVHCRISTGGKKDDLNCHPFALWHKNCVEGYFDCVFFHNGMLNSLGFDGDDKINDTQEFKNKILNRMSRNFFVHHDVWTMLDSLITRTGSKFVFLDSKYGLQIINRDAFTEEDGLLFSNTNWKHTFDYSSKHYLYDDDDFYFGGYNNWWYENRSHSNDTKLADIKSSDIADDYEGEEENVYDQAFNYLNEKIGGYCIDIEYDGYSNFGIYFDNKEDYDTGCAIAKSCIKGFDIDYDKAGMCLYVVPNEKFEAEYKSFVASQKKDDDKDKFVDEGSTNLFK